MSIGRNTQLLNAALEYLDAGYSIIPVGQDKKPLISWIEFQKRQATREEVKEWWTRHPEANIGMVTGSISGICAVDNDDPNSKHQLLKTIDEFAQPPVSMTPRGGNHMIFGMPEKEVRNTVNFMEKVDFRGEGGYIVVPPSTNGNGKGYIWKRNILVTDIPVLPDSLIKAIQNSDNYFSSLKRTKINTNTTPITPNASIPNIDCPPAVTSCDIFKEGQRDENLFHIANCLTQTKNSDLYIQQVLRAITLSWGERDEKWIATKIESAMKRMERRERNIAAEVAAFVGVTSGDFSVTECDKFLNLVTTRDKAASRKALQRLKDNGIIEKRGNRDGTYRRVDQDVEFIDFEEEEGMLSNVKLPLRLDELVEVCEGNIILCSGEYNAGKGHPYGTKILTSKGMKNIEELVIGETLYSEKGEEIKLQEIYPRGLQDCYKFTFTDGTSIETDMDHIWTILHGYNRLHKTTGRGNKNNNFKEYMNITTREIISMIGVGDIPPKKRFVLPQIEPIKYGGKSYSLDPYMLGVLLGDGGLSHSSVMLSSEDEPILDYFRNNGFVLRWSGGCSYRVIGMKPIIKSLLLDGLTSEKKFIPRQYLYGSVDDRLALLRGLLDTDGYVTKKRVGAEYVTVSPELAEGVIFLVRSLGGRAVVSTKNTRYLYNGEIKSGKLAYRISIKMNHLCPFLLQRKAEQYKTGTKRDGKIIKTIEYSGTKRTICIKVSNPTGLYIADGFIVTHNTGFCLNTLQMNKNGMRIRYISSEMKAGEFKKRWRNFGLPYDFWLPDEMTDYVKLNNNLCSIIVPDALNIIDYMEFKDGDYTKGAEYLTQIHDKLTTGVAVVAIQHKEGSRLPRAGDLVMEKPRLSIAFRKTPTTDDRIAGSVEILKAKNIRKGKCDGKKLMFEIVDGGSRFKVTNDWAYYR